ncbi:MAG TPA: tail fiber domain-containing protein [Chitinophagaceae bacterium]|jgi:hypothetical protein|nr:tail fiber domain-containing protein [Chitinophagaceae bacterium]
MNTRFYLSRAMALIGLSALMHTAGAQNTAPYWSLAGNSPAASTIKLGTTNNTSLRLYANNVQRMILHAGSGYVGIGTSYPAQKLDVSGNINLGKGYSLYMENHRVLRVDSLLSSTFLGNAAGAQNAHHFNTGIGFEALKSNIVGSRNTATGAGTLMYNLNGGFNTATGYYALQLNTSGSFNTATGFIALSSNTTGTYNMATGQAALANNRTGSYNTAAGGSALFNNNGNDNTAVGVMSLNAAAGASGNTAVGAYAGQGYDHGWNNTFIGSDANATYHYFYNSMALGSAARVTASNQVRIGNAYTTSIGGYAAWTNVSDGRVKRNIRADVPGLSFILKLKPVTYNLDLDAAERISGAAATRENGAPRPLSPAEQADRAARQQVVYTGFIAQEVEQAAEELNYHFSGVDTAKNEKDLYGLRYTEFVMPLVKAVQELSGQADSARLEVAALKAQLADQQRQIGELRQLIAAQQGGTPPGPAPSSHLGQNQPNPAGSQTHISYTLPAGVRRAQLVVTDSQGRTVYTAALRPSGTLVLHTAGWSSGVYHYSLVADGTVLETRRMEILR